MTGMHIHHQRHAFCVRGAADIQTDRQTELQLTNIGHKGHEPCTFHCPSAARPWHDHKLVMSSVDYTYHSSLCQSRMRAHAYAYGHEYNFDSDYCDTHNQ